MTKLIVTHKNPDIDAIGAVWLLKRFAKEEFGEALVMFVPAGGTYQGKNVDSDEEIVHVDTGEGKFDHHQKDEEACASMLVYEHLVERHPELQQDEALERVVAQINDIDHFRSFFWPEPTHDRYFFFLEEILNGFKLGGHGDDEDLARLGLDCLDGVYTTAKIIVEAEKELTKGQEFKTRFGKALGLLTSNDLALKLAQKKGYTVVVRKDPAAGNIRIKAAPIEGIDLTKAYEAIKAKDKKGTWYFHISKKMILNGSSKHPGQRPSPLTLDQVIEILKEA